MGTIILISIYGKGFLKIIPILIGIGVGYVVSLFLGVVDFSSLSSAEWIAMPPITLPKFDLNSILILLPITLSTLLEHIGDVKTASRLTGNDFAVEPGLHRTLIGDGVGTMISGFLGFTPNTSYSEGLATMALTGYHTTDITVIAAAAFILLSYFGKLSGFLLTIPKCVIGAASFVLYGMIACIGLNTLYSEKVDFGKLKNILIAAVMLGFGLGGATITIGTVTLSSIALAAIFGITLNVLIKE